MWRITSVKLETPQITSQMEEALKINALNQKQCKEYIADVLFTCDHKQKLPPQIVKGK